MKNLRIIFIVILISFLAYQNSFGQANEDVKFKFGFGTTILEFKDWYRYTGDVNSIYFIFDIGNNWRVEPSFGFLYTFEDGFEDYSYGLGVFKKRPYEKFNILYGIRTEIWNTDLKLIAPTIGGEYYFLKRFSIGTEVQLNLIYDGHEWGLLTSTSFITRFYF